jgi:hypothetical protein
LQVSGSGEKTIAPPNYIQLHQTLPCAYLLLVAFVCARADDKSN